MKLFKKANAQRRVGMLNKIGAEAAIAEGMGDEALDMSDKAVLAFKGAGDKYGMAGATITMANLFSEMGEFDKATYRAEAAADMFKKLKLNLDAAAAFRTACFAFLDKKMF